MSKVHLSFSAVCYIHAYTRYKTASRTAIEGCRVEMHRKNIQNNYPKSWVCGANITQDGMADDWVTQNGFKDGRLVTCPQCIQIIKKYGEK